MLKFPFLNLLKQTIKTDRHVYIEKKRSVFLPVRLFRSIFTSINSPLFIIGSPRSGTTILGKCIGEINSISYHFEPAITKYFSNHIYNNQIPHWYAKLIYRITYKILLKIHLDGDLTFAEKTPRNSFLIPFLNSVFPDAKFIHIIRDGRDAALSHSKKPWLRADSVNSDLKEPGGFKYGPYPRYWVEKSRYKEFEATTDIHRCIWAWKRHVESALEATKNFGETKLLVINYSDLVQDSYKEGIKILDFLDVKNHDSEENFMKAVSKIHDKSIGKWRSEISEKDLDLVELEAGELLYQLGFK